MDKQLQVRINNQELEVKESKGQRIVTFKDIDKVHERVEGTAKRNFSENKDHLLENVDYFLVKGDELRSLKQSTNFVLSNAREITLLTESGYLMLVKSLTDDLAWEVQRQLVSNYFRVQALNPYAGLSKEVQAIFAIDKKAQEIENRVNYLEDNMLLFNAECKELQGLVRKIGIQVLGGYRSKAYRNNSLRGKVYSDIQQQIKREFGVTRYEAIKRRQLDTAKKIVIDYKVPFILENEINLENSQICF